jgi:putative transposase
LSADSEQGLEEAIIINRVKELRRQMPRLGGRKLQYLLSPLLVQHGIDIGRDKLFDILADNGLLVRRRKRRRVATTDSNHPYRRYPNLVKDMEVLAAERLWVSDITYISLKEDFGYLSLVTDAYSRKIVGYCLYPTLKSEGPLQALDMALGQYGNSGNLIHHSDRGCQYCCQQYTGLLQTKGIRISMTEKGDPYENAIAERVNGILKGELGLDEDFDNFEQAKEAVDKAVDIYNTLRPHASCNYMTPQQAHVVTGEIRKRWKPSKRKREPVLSEV